MGARPSAGARRYSGPTLCQREAIQPCPTSSSPHSANFLLPPLDRDRGAALGFFAPTSSACRTRPQWIQKVNIQSTYKALRVFRTPMARTLLFGLATRACRSPGLRCVASRRVSLSLPNARRTLDPWLCLASFLLFDRFLVLSLGTWLEAASLGFRLTLVLGTDGLHAARTPFLGGALPRFKELVARAQPAHAYRKAWARGSHRT
jgi:hypothetical protein